MARGHHKFGYRAAAPLCVAMLVTIGFLFGNSIVSFMAYEGTVLGQLRLTQAQASLAVWDHYLEGHARGEAEPTSAKTVESKKPMVSN